MLAMHIRENLDHRLLAFTCNCTSLHLDPGNFEWVVPASQHSTHHPTGHFLRHSKLSLTISTSCAEHHTANGIGEALTRSPVCSLSERDGRATRIKSLEPLLRPGFLKHA